MSLCSWFSKTHKKPPQTFQKTQCHHYNLTLKNPDGKIPQTHLSQVFHAPETSSVSSTACPLSLSSCASTKVRYIGMSMQASFIPQQDEMLRVQSCLCAAHYYGDGTALRLDVRPKSGDWAYLYTPLPPATHHSLKYIHTTGYWASNSCLWKMTQDK